MGHHISCLAYIQALLISLLIQANTVPALSWPGRTSALPTAEQAPILELSSSSSQLLRVNTKPSTSYEFALDELEKLELEPLCHRTAARLLVNNCRILEGKDEATILTDSGRKIRDFVDSYAASLAICDLERGHFVIPKECTKFQEPALSQLPIQNAPNLHVTSAEIDACLSSLGASDSAWNTWVSYRHKALRFCEAARADNEKTQNIILFQRLAKIMTRLADDVDTKVEQRMNDIDMRAQAVGEKVESLSPLLEKLQRDLENADNMLSHRLFQGIKKSQEQVNSGIESAVHLERMLQLILRSVMDGHAEAAAIHDQSLQHMNQRATSEIEIIGGAMAAAVSATIALQNQIETSCIQAADLEYRQAILEQGMQRLIDVSDTLASEYNVHTSLLQQAQNITNEILDKLGDTAASATAIGDMFLGPRAIASWWPYIWCPVVSLVMGSYGLNPSMVRNIGLIALGEAAGFMVSYSTSLSFDFIRKPATNPSESFIRDLQTTDADQNFTHLTSQFELP
ncbi:hypothetical protein E0Z10_g609 [Xylaria hypoxylon]|uniref:Nuclear membrane fusion protein Kar5 n=1 Tax=Xylaria hypoxylon TaxID=37992 RepID=A0A4Z0Z9B2_9PEZI|nr:hypothetical protein E0Z10_g609 [Xylaria hypoxylon]